MMSTIEKIKRLKLARQVLMNIDSSLYMYVIGEIDRMLERLEGELT